MSRSDYFGLGPSPDRPAGALNSLAGRVANNVRTGQISREDALAYLRRKAGSEKSFEYVLWAFQKHLKETMTGASGIPPVERPLALVRPEATKKKKKSERPVRQEAEQLIAALLDR